MENQNDCEECSGEGVFRFVSYQMEEYYETDTDTCLACKGTGKEHNEEKV